MLSPADNEALAAAVRLLEEPSFVAGWRRLPVSRWGSCSKRYVGRSRQRN